MTAYQVKLIAWGLALLLAGCTQSRQQDKTAFEAAPESPPSPTTRVAVPKAPPADVIPEIQRQLLKKWFVAVGSHRHDETFGELVVRSGMFQAGKPYSDPPQEPGLETIKINIETFQCVSFVEQSLALARCIWLETPNEDCFVTEVERSRYRSGHRTNYASRLHYFTEWLSDNAMRDRLEILSGAMGGKPTAQEYSFMTVHRERYPGIQASETLKEMMEIERRLSHSNPVIVTKGLLATSQDLLRTGDIVAFVGTKPGLLVTHTGFVYRKAGRPPQVLHASSYHKKVFLTQRDISSYVNSRPERRGVLVARPLPPVLSDSD